MKLALVAALSLVQPSHGWYDPVCCSDRDCAPYDGVVEEVPGGWRADGIFIPAKDAKPSRDGRYHLCRMPATGRVLCLYVPLAG